MTDLQITISFEELLALLDRLTPDQRVQVFAHLTTSSISQKSTVQQYIEALAAFRKLEPEITQLLLSELENLTRQDLDTALEAAKQRNAASDFVDAHTLAFLAAVTHNTKADDDYYSLENVNRRLYRRARQYWRDTGITDHLELSDADLDAQFWGFDKEGVPHLKSEVADPAPPPGSAAALAAAAKHHEFVSGDSTISARSRAILETEFADYLRERTTSEDRDAS